MTKEHTLSTDWIPGAGVGLIGSAVAWLLSWRISAAKMEGSIEAKEKAEVVLLDARAKAEMIRSDDLRADLRDLKEDWRAGIADVKRLAENVAAVQASQNVVNAVTAKALESLTEKMDRHEACLADHTNTIRMIVDKVMTR